MQAIVRVFLCVFLSCSLAHAATVHSSFESLGEDLFRIRYDVSDFDFLENQELAIQFDPTVYRELGSPMVPLGFDVLLFQPGDPLGTAGVFSAMALMNHPALAGGFSLDVRMVAFHRPGAQSFAINQLDERGSILAAIAEGRTVTTTPEPASVGLVGTTLVVACAAPAIRRRLKKLG